MSFYMILSGHLFSPSSQTRRVQKSICWILLPAFVFQQVLTITFPTDKIFFCFCKAIGFISLITVSFLIQNYTLVTVTVTICFLFVFSQHSSQLVSSSMLTIISSSHIYRSIQLCIFLIFYICDCFGQPFTQITFKKNS